MRLMVVGSVGVRQYGVCTVDRVRVESRNTPLSGQVTLALGVEQTFGLSSEPSGGP